MTRGWKIIGLIIITWIFAEMGDQGGQRIAGSGSDADAYQNELEREDPCGKNQLDMAFIMMQTEVTRRLKSPSSAKYPWKYSKGSRPLGDCVFRVKAYVDASNSFGAKIRTSFLGTIRYYPRNKSWQVKTLKIGN